MKSKDKQCSISFVGKYEVTVLGDGRIILPSGAIGQLKDREIKKVLVGKLPRHRALILCPDVLWGKWLQEIRRTCPCLKDHDGARDFLVPWQSIHWDTKGRVSLPKRARDYLGIGPYDTIIIVGIHYYFELWAEEEFVQITRECESALGKQGRL